MKPTPSFPDDAACDDSAAAWLCEREAGFAPGRAEAFAAWCAEDPRHAAAVQRVERALALLDELPAVRGELEARVGALAPAPVVAGPRRWFARPAAWAAGLAAALLLVGAAWWNLPDPVSRGAVAHYAAVAMEPRRVTLDDGSVVDLNAGSRMTVAFSAAERRVTLEVGEAHFDVRRDRARPFVVAAGGVAVRAVGTAFNVRLVAETVDVLVVEGRVEVAAVASAPSAPAMAAPQLGAGERLQVARAKPEVVPPVEKVAPDSIRALLAWQEPLATFSDVPLREIVERFNRRNAVQIVFADPAIGERRIGGVIALDQVENFVRLLEQDGDLAADRSRPGTIVLRLRR